MPADRRRLSGAIHRPALAERCFDALLAHVLKGAIELVAHLIPDDPADADPARLGECLQSRRNIHSVAVNVAVALDDHVAEVDTDAELNPLLSLIALDHPALDLDGATHAIHNAGKLRQKTVAGVLYGAPPVLADLRLDQLLEVRFEPFVRPLLIRSHKPTVARHVGGQDRGEAADRGHFGAGARLA
jgi:hypothetical protein